MRLVLTLSPPSARSHRLRPHVNLPPRVFRESLRPWGDPQGPARPAGKPRESTARLRMRRSDCDLGRAAGRWGACAKCSGSPLLFTKVFLLLTRVFNGEGHTPLLFKTRRLGKNQSHHFYLKII